VAKSGDLIMEICPKFLKRVEKAITQCETKHYMYGGNGISCFVWVNGPSKCGKGVVKKLVGGSIQALDLNKFDIKIKKVTGYVSHDVNID